MTGANRKIIALNSKLVVHFILILLIAITVVGCVPSLPTPTHTPSNASKTDPIEILVSDIVTPASSQGNISAYMPSSPLKKGDIVSSESGEEYPIDDNTWFIFIDDNPGAFFAHDCRYVFMDTTTMSWDVVHESWPPEINGVSMWDEDKLNRGHLINLYSVLDRSVSVSGNDSTAPRADFGDAPDGQDAYYGITGHFPTLFNTANSNFSNPGVHTLNIGEETLGTKVSAEKDANDPNDSDGVPNLVDSDSDERVFVVQDGLNARLAFIVSVSNSAPEQNRYVNILIDFDQSGNWSNGTCGAEWVTTNMEINVSPGSSETIMTPDFAWGKGCTLPSPVWMRILLSRNKIDETAYSSVGGWDGSGEFKYGEVEDHFVFLMEKPPFPERVIKWPPVAGKPPGGGPPPGGGGGGAPPAGPAKGPCGYDINYHVITINCGDTSKDLANGTPIVQASTETMEGATGDQGYTSSGSLGPGKSGNSQTSLANIGNAFDQLATAVKCGDHVLIYICGHGKKSGGIAIKNTSGHTQEVMKPTDGAKDDGKDNSLEDFLNKIPACPDQDCDMAGACCHVSVILESCFAGNFDVPGVTGEGRAVVGTSTNTESWATYPGGGVYTEGLAGAMGDEDSDTTDPPDGVDPMEANESGKNSVKENNNKNKQGQKPWEDNQWCDCKCPCKPDIDVEKYVWDSEGGWVDEMVVSPGQPVTFLIEIENTGKCRDIVDVSLADSLPSCLEFAGSTIMEIDGQILSRPPDNVMPLGSGTQLTWDLSDIGPLSPGDSLSIEFDAIAHEPGINLNQVDAEAHCSKDYSVIVSDFDTAAVFVLPYEEEPPPPTPEEVLYVGVEVHAESTVVDTECYSNIMISFEAEDLTGGDYPLSNVILLVNGEIWYNSGFIQATNFHHYIESPADCGQTFDIIVTATNNIELEASASSSITTPTP